ncbi:conserved hypothetical protein [Desulfamplus magnetovallimortis]|uniref:Nudix hydrolase domain-containing protein n=2 Tax=Desulfamplus magnetovallimortis TaxID=1246637 RepID=A0A1W1H783_9BACT|nr:conserved hypothetical protein [Desulfamplus magnetovallimortis]
MLRRNGQCYQIIKDSITGSAHPVQPPTNVFQPTSVMVLFVFGNESVNIISSDNTSGEKFYLDTLPPDENPGLIFIQKADIKGYPWRNQMAFPGGNCDPDDASREATALRELEEEVNISSENVEMLGSIGHFQTINNKDIEAFAGIWKKMGDIYFDPSEISRIFRIPVAHLLTIHHDKNFTGRRPDLYELVYPYDDVVIWGVTAKIVHHLMEIMLPEIIPFCDALSYGR